MHFYRLILLCLLVNSLAIAAASGSSYPEAAEPGVQLSLTESAGRLFVAGDAVRLVIKVDQLSQLPADSFTIAVRLEAGLLLSDNFWLQKDNVAYRKLSREFAKDSLLLDVRLKIAPGFSGHKLTATAFLTETPEQEESLTISVARLLSSRKDTCLYLRDSNLNTINTFLSTRRIVEAQLEGPIDLSPTAPLSISPGNCPAFILKPGKKKEKQKEKCSCLQYIFGETEGVDYPARFTPGPKKLKGCTSLFSNGRIGDTISISLKTLDGKPLKGIMLTDGEGAIIDAIADAPKFTFEQVLTTAANEFALHLRARRLLGVFPRKKYCLIEVLRKPASVTLMRDTGSPPEQPTGDTLTLAREILTQAEGQTVWVKTVALRGETGTTFLRIHETVDESGRSAMLSDTISRDSCDGPFLISKGPQSIAYPKWDPVDTLLFQAAETEVSIVGRRNLFGSQRSLLEVIVPLQINAADPPARDSLIALAYWLGIGEVPIKEYAALAEEVPPEWAQPGTSAPLAAYGLARPVILPGLSPGEHVFQRSYVSYDFISASGREAFTKDRSYTPVIRRNPKRPNSGIISGTALAALRKMKKFDSELGKEVLPFYLGLANRHDINSFRVQLKIVAYYQVTVPGKSWRTVSP